MSKREKYALDLIQEYHELKENSLTEQLNQLRELNKELFNCIRTSHLDMSGKHRYVISHDAYKVIEPLRQLINGE